LARRSKSVGPNDRAFLDDAVSSGNAMQTDVLGFQAILQQLGSDKGLANYDKNDQLETQLKGIVNTFKNGLSDLDEIVYQVPAAGPVLGPIVYEIKCTLDEVLDATENLTDALLNSLTPSLKA
ncbi:hypothetical protein K438DRAFT_1591763, partial [Mycena galopus ATCC 62051]